MGREFVEMLPLLVELTRVQHPVFSVCQFHFQVHAAVLNRHLLSLTVEFPVVGHCLVFWMVALAGQFPPTTPVFPRLVVTKICFLPVSPRTFSSAILVSVVALFHK